MYSVSFVLLRRYVQAFRQDGKRVRACIHRWVVHSEDSVRSDVCIYQLGAKIRAPHERILCPVDVLASSYTVTTRMVNVLACNKFHELRLCHAY